MAQPNVAREPSMEEILASIRRIIENNDPVESIDNASYSAQTQNAAETIELTIDDDIAMMVADAAPAAPLVQPSESVVAPRQPERLEQPAARPMSLADVAARVKAASERRAPAAPANDTERQVQSAPAPMVDEERSEPVETFVAPAYSAPAVSADASFFSSAEPVSAPSYEVEEVALDTYEPATNEASEPVSEVTVSADEANEVELDPIERFAVQIGNEIASAVPAQLLSPTTEEKVSRSFEELADALGGSKRTLDEIAEEMLKPMLQEWLDDNLPTLVERLVREEIERVARGPRR
ncbi:DUF2497 domain-containing protein [Rhizobium sp. C4]|uniref:DUF2497 domain-containing protein n=1 Tax=Rhizobium sp. C4 TaxID=1349800 RepID=UPI001E3C2D51|nr:DUF2497 domain-containing protein [Rhizobium sp. C4]MCD2176032.1 DUF2497 domain-containing protein [Rhizobium sp. C4]